MIELETILNTEPDPLRLNDDDSPEHGAEHIARSFLRAIFWPDRLYGMFPWTHFILYFLIVFSFVGALLERHFGAANVTPLLNFIAELAFLGLGAGIFIHLGYELAADFLAALIGIGQAVVEIIKTVYHLVRRPRQTT